MEENKIYWDNYIVGALSFALAGHLLRQKPLIMAGVGVIVADYVMRRIKQSKYSKNVFDKLRNIEPV